MIDHLNGEFSCFGHMKRGSVRVKLGQALKQGDILGLIGASGDSLFPHLPYELRTGPGITGVEGLPSRDNQGVMSPDGFGLERPLRVGDWWRWFWR